MDKNDIARLVANSDSVVGADMLTNRERTAYICSVFDVDAIQLTARFDFDQVLAVGDPEVLYASIQLASLQFEYATRLHLAKFIEDDDYLEVLSFLELAKSKMRWAFSFRRFDMEVPAYPFLN